MKKLFLLFALLAVMGNLFAQTVTTLSPAPIQQFFGADGIPLTAGKLCSYLAGTSTPAPTFVDSTGATQNTNPITLTAGGFARIWLTPGVLFKFILYDSTGHANTCDGNLIWSVDNIIGPAPSTAGAIRWNSIADPNGNQLLNMGLYTSSWNSNGLSYPNFYFDPLHGFGFTTDLATGPTPTFASSPPTGFELRNNGAVGATFRSTTTAAAKLNFTSSTSTASLGIGSTLTRLSFEVPTGTEIGAIFPNGESCYGWMPTCGAAGAAGANNQLALIPTTTGWAGEVINMANSANYPALEINNEGSSAPALSITKAHPQTAVTNNASYLSLGGQELGLNSYVPIAFGSVSATNPAVWLGYKETDATAAGKGSLIFATRNVTTDTAATEQLTIGPTGTVTAAGVVNAVGGFQVNGAATLNNCLVGNGTAFLSVSCVTAAATVPVYVTSGTLIISAHQVIGTGTLSGGSVGISLTGAAAFTGQFTYVCVITGTTDPANSWRFIPLSGNSFNVTGTNSDQFVFLCEGD